MDNCSTVVTAHHVHNNGLPITLQIRAARSQKQSIQIQNPTHRYSSIHVVIVLFCKSHKGGGRDSDGSSGGSSCQLLGDDGLVVRDVKSRDRCGR